MAALLRSATVSGVGTPKISVTVSALHFFFDRPELARHLSFVHEPRKVPL
jgi:hypothetical protein